MHRFVILMAASFLCAQSTLADPPVEPPASQPAATEPATLDEAAKDEWTITLEAYVYSVPDDTDYLQPTLSIDHDWLHLEGRYNYEDFDTGSAWMGYNLHFGDELSLDLTPMAGVVFGDLEGVAPGYEFTLAWKGFSLYSEGEYVFDTDDSDASFFYTWSELTWSPCEWFRFGWADQLTKEEHADVFDENGPMAGVTIGPVDFTAYVFNIDDHRPTVIIGFAVEF